MERIIQRVERVHSDTKEDTIRTVTKRWWEQIDNYTDYVNLLVESMRVSIICNRDTLCFAYLFRNRYLNLTN